MVGYVVALPLEQATVTLRTNFTGTLDVSRALFPLLQPHARVVNISSTAGLLSIVQPHLQEKLSSPSLTEQELVALMAKFVEDVRIGRYNVLLSFDVLLYCEMQFKRKWVYFGNS